MSDPNTVQHTAEGLIEYLRSGDRQPLFVLGDSLKTLASFPPSCIDCCMTSPPYWGQRTYTGGGIGLEETHGQYIENLLAIIVEVKRVLKPTGSFWLNIGDTYHRKSLIGIPWRVALAMTDRQGWILRNSVIWNKIKGGPDNADDKLRNVYENVFHFVKSDPYFYDTDAIRRKPGQAKVINGAVVSATGVSGVRYRQQIELSTSLTEAEKQAAYRALDSLLNEVRLGRLSPAAWKAVAAAQHCLFLNRQCRKNRKSEPEITIGTCTMIYGRQLQPVMICPFRLLERSQIFPDCIHLLKLHEPGNELRIVAELAVPGGSIDYCLVSVHDGKTRDFVGIELQTLDTTGTVWPER
jgi:DNA methylase